MRGVQSLHDLGLALLFGGIASALVAAVTLFEHAPTREIAGQVGQVVFQRLGWVVLGASAVVFATRLFLTRTEPAGRARSAALTLASICLGVSLLVVLVITPRMAAIWYSVPHAPDGTGLTGDDRRLFMTLHGVANLSYTSMMVMGAAQIVLRAAGRGTR